ncbi:unnamed protein product, partial [Symbiodinium sp. CCMP2456]
RQAKLQDLEARLAALEGTAGGDDGVLPSRKTGEDAQIMKQVATCLQDFESQCKPISIRSSATSVVVLQQRNVDGAGGAAGLDTMAEDLDQLTYDVGELKDLLGR